MNSASTRQRGFILIIVVVALIALSAMALLLTNSTSQDRALLESQAQSDQLDFVVEAGLQHARWELAQNTSCDAYTDLPLSEFSDYSYSASFTPGIGSPIAITTTGYLKSGDSRSKTLNSHPVFEIRTTSVIQPDALTGIDTQLYKWYPGVNYGTYSTLGVSNKFSDSLTFSLLKFDVSEIPLLATIISATLDLHQNWGGGKGGDVGIHLVTSAWNEGTKSGQPGATNWTARETATAWTTAGGDYIANAYGSSTIPSNTEGRFSWDVTSLVASWASGEYANNGLIMVPATPGTNLQFDSSDAATPANHPRLTVVYACECGAGVPGSLFLQPGVDGKDALLISGSKSNENTGSGKQIWISSGGSGHNGLLEFDLSELPAGVEIEAATLAVYDSGPDATTSDAAIGLFRVTTPWIEGSGVQTGSTPANGVSWDASDGINPWVTAGGDYDPTMIGSVAIPDVTPRWLEYDVKTLVTDWAEGTYPNNGVLLKAVSGSLTKSHLVSGDDTGSPELNPKLIISYSCDCGSIVPTGALAIKPGSASGKDTFLAEWTQPQNFGANTAMRLSNVAGSSQHGLLQFDLSALPAGVSVTSAELKLEMTQTGSGGPGTGYLYQLTSPWVEAEASWLESATLVNWLAPGGDYAPTAVASAAIDTTPGPVQWDVTSIVASWANGEVANTGLVLGVSAGLDGVEFASSDAAIASYRPELVINFGCPCGATCAPLAAPVLDYFDTLPLACGVVGRDTGSAGSEDWSLWAWAEIGEAPNWCSGTVEILPDLGDESFLLKAHDRGVERELDLSLFDAATLSFSYRFFEVVAGNSLRVRVSADGGVSWVDLTPINGPADHAAYQDISYDIGAYRAPNTRIGFIASMPGSGGGSANKIYIDDIKVSSEAASASSGAYRDEFNLDTNYAGSDGLLNWSMDWLEIGETSNPQANDVRILADVSSYQLKLAKNDRGIVREADLSTCATSTLSFDYRRQAFDNASDYVTIDASDDGGISWDEIDRIEGPGTDASYLGKNYDLNAYRVVNARIRFLTSPTLHRNDHLYIDNVHITCP